MLRIPLLLTLLAAMIFPVTAGADDTAPPPEPSVPPIPSNPLVPSAPKHKRKRKHVALGTRAARYARRFVGVRYTYGGLSPRTGFSPLCWSNTFWQSLLLAPSCEPKPRSVDTAAPMNSRPQW